MDRAEKLAIIGAGKWGKYLIRNFSEILGERNVTVCDSDTKRLAETKENHLEVDTTQNEERVFTDPSIPAVVVATPASTHYDLTKKALEHNKHVLVERPLAEKIRNAAGLVKLARSKDKTLWSTTYWSRLITGIHPGPTELTT